VKLNCVIIILSWIEVHEFLASIRAQFTSQPVLLPALEFQKLIITFSERLLDQPTGRLLVTGVIIHHLLQFGSGVMQRRLMCLVLTSCRRLSSHEVIKVWVCVQESQIFVMLFGHLTLTLLLRLLQYFPMPLVYLVNVRFPEMFELTRRYQRERLEVLAVGRV
jgi:hypothetical protein